MSVRISGVEWSGRGTIESRAGDTLLVRDREGRRMMLPLNGVRYIEVEEQSALVGILFFSIVTPIALIALFYPPLLIR
jgi:hypothetical protein